MSMDGDRKNIKYDDKKNTAEPNKKPQVMETNKKEEPIKPQVIEPRQLRLDGGEDHCYRDYGANKGRNAKIEDFPIFEYNDTYDEGLQKITDHLKSGMATEVTLSKIPSIFKLYFERRITQSITEITEDFDGE